MENFPRYWPFVRGIHRSPVNSPHKGQWRGALMSSLICVWINGSVNNREAEQPTTLFYIFLTETTYQNKIEQDDPIHIAQRCILYKLSTPCITQNWYPFDQCLGIHEDKHNKKIIREIAI